ncbi:MAG: YfiR/HmsC family protein [Nitrosomonas sp.]|nr:YfiR/HmsC family protein [Nitrosomonas sp.]
MRRIYTNFKLSNFSLALKHNYKLLFCILFVVLASKNTYAHANTTHPKENLLAVYIFKLAEHIQWPHAAQKSRYHFHLIDENNRVEQQLKNISHIRKLHEKEFIVTRSTGANIPEGVELVFIAHDKIEEYSQIFSSTENTSTLLITERLHNDRIALIDLHENIDHEISFQINKANILNRNLGLNPDIILLGGTEIDVAALYKEGLQNIQAQNEKLDNLQKEIDSQQKRDEQLKTDLKETKQAGEQLSSQLTKAEQRINQQNIKIGQLQKEIEIKHGELETLRNKTLEIEEVITHKNKVIEERETQSKKLKLAILENSRILDEKKNEIKFTATQLEMQESIISNQKKFLILSIIIGLLSVLLLVLTYLAYRNKNSSNKLLESNAKELALAKKMAEHHTLAKSMFLSNMSHELRSPLNAIIGFSHLINKNPLTPTAIKENSNIIMRSANHLLELINDVLEMAKIESGKIELNEVDFDLFGLLEDVENMTRILAKEKNLSLIFDFSRTCPHYIRADEKKIRRIFINLLNNAIKFTEEGGIALRLKCSSAGNDLTRMFCEIEDSGIGITADNLKKIFNPFTQATMIQAKNGMPGTGLGLSICKELIEHMQGSITAESQPGVGTVFKFDFIVSNASQNVLPRNLDSEMQYPSVKKGQEKVKALIVEDIEDNRLYLDNILRNSHCSVVSVLNGLEAVNAFKSSQFDIIFMDRRMPVMDGIEATTQIRKLPGGKDIKIIAVTASAFKEDQEKIMRHGFDDFIRKPYLVEEIHNCLTKHLKLEFIYQPVSPEAGEKDTNNKNAELKEKLQGLTTEEITMLRSIVLALDIENAINFINTIKKQHPELADDLQQLVESYNFGYIQTLIQEIQEGK